MSVLLEALKKAAADKKKVSDRSIQSNQTDVPSVQKKILEENTQPKMSLEGVELSSTVEDSLDNAIEIPSVISEEKPIKSLKLTLDKPVRTEKIAPSLSSTAEKSVTKATFKLAIEESCKQKEVTFDEISETVEMLDEQPLLKMGELEDKPLEENLESSVQKDLVSPELAPIDLNRTEAIEPHIAEQNVDEIVTPVPTQSILGRDKGEKACTSKTDNVAESNKKSLEIELEVDKEIETVTAELEQKSNVLLHSSESQTGVNIDKSSLKEDEDSYKWSLDSLPGYLALGRGKKKKDSKERINPILVAGALSEATATRRATKKNPIKLIIITLISISFIAVLTYGGLYYQEQNKALEQDMKKYNLVKTPIVVDEVSHLNDQDSKEGVEAPVEPTAEKALSKTPLNREVKGNYSALGLEENSEKVILQDKSDAMISVNESIIQERVNPERVREKQINHRIVNTSKPSKLSLDKSLIDASNNVSNKATIKVHSEEAVLAEAYVSYEEGDFFHAQPLFESVLKINPNNEFALIALGNMLSSEQKYDAAMSYYQSALAAEPFSLNAFEAIANIASHIDLSSEWKKELLDMAQDHSESAPLQYALGNLYAEEQDWLAAQRAYFQAVALESDNADYLVNLAVSLDQLGKYNLAARYYTEALAFVDVEAVNFNETQVKSRLISIRLFMEERSQ